MSATFYLFDVDHGQSAALKLPNGRWCIFDVGRTSQFSPVEWVANKETFISRLLGMQPDFKFLKGTVSHLHGDHLADSANLFPLGPEFLKSVDSDQDYLNDCYSTCSDDSTKRMVYAFAQNYQSGFSPATTTPDYGGVAIRELSLPVTVARQIGGDANARVNNASVATRIDIYGNSILLCGDIQKEAWEAIISDTGMYGSLWRPLVSNIDIMVAPHHGHKSGYSTDLLNLAQPSIVLISVVSRDPHVDSRYSQSPVKGMKIGDTDYGYISTRQKGHIKVEIRTDQAWLKGTTYWTFGNAAIT